MLIIPALIVAVMGGTLAAMISLIAGFGWLSTLVAYWLAGNALLMAMLIPHLLLRRCADQPQPDSQSGGLRVVRPMARILMSVGWITLGLSMVFWQAFHSDGPVMRAPHAHDIGAVLGLGDSGSAPQRYLGAWGAPPAVKMPLDHLLRLDLWVVGLAAYLFGLLRLLSAAIERG